MKHPTQNPTTDSSHNKPIKVRPMSCTPRPCTPTFVRIAMSSAMPKASARRTAYEWLRPTLVSASRVAIMATFALVHGGGGGAWDWHLVVPELRKRGHEPRAVDLP